MTREQYTHITRQKLDEFKLNNWGVRLTTNPSHPLGICSYKDKCIILNAHHLDSHPHVEIMNTILHEIAHALCPGMGHNDIWSDKARELGCDNTLPCASFSLNPKVIDAIRSGADIEVTFEEQVIRTPKYQITRLQDKCPECGKVAKEKNSFTSILNGEEYKFTILECLHVVKKLIPKGTPFHTLVSNSWKDEVKNCKHEWDKNLCLKCGEFRLFDFQISGAQFIETAVETGKGGLIADEMGLGKTIQGLAVLKFHPELFPALFIVKSGLKFQFSKEILRWLGPEYIAQVIETGNHYVFPNFKSYIISYDLIRRIDRNKFPEFKSIILDECQQIKNPDSTRTHGVRLLAKTPKVIALSGTPWKNRGSEFFSVLNLIDPGKFYSYDGYCKVWVDYFYEGAKRKEGGIKNPLHFKEFTKDIVIRRERTEVMKELPLINRTKLHVKLNEMEQKTYDKEVSEFVRWYNDYVQEGKEDTIDSLELLARMSRMRHLVGLAKIQATVEFVDEFIENEPNKRLVIFVHHIDVGEILHRELKKKYPHRYISRLVGGLSPEARFDVQEKFNMTKGAILVASTLAAGEGLNLQTCADCIMHERQWNPGNEEQAEGRFIRIGQEANQVNATYVEGEETIDAHFDKLVDSKRRNFHVVMNKGEIPTWNESSMIKELAEKIFEKYKKKKVA